MALRLADIQGAARDAGVPDLSLLLLLSVERGRVGECCSTRNGRRYCSAGNDDRNRDCGPFQVNSQNFPVIARAFGVPQGDAAAIIRDNGCANAHVAAWLLDRFLGEAHGNLFEAMGLYHSAAPVEKARYQQRLRVAFRRWFATAYMPTAGR